MRSVLERQSPLQPLSSRAGKASAAKPASLQSAFGNQAAQRLARLAPARLSPRIQTRLTVNQPGDEFEREADQVAEQVMRMPEPQVQRACACGGACADCQSGEEEEPQHLQTQRLSSGGGSTAVAPPIVHEALASPGQPLDPATRAYMEPRFGADFSGVRIHAGDAAERSAQAVQASAYTVGRDIVFGAGRFAPGTDEGRRLLAHELVHTLQQGGTGTLRRKPKPLTPEEKEENLESPNLKDDERLQKAFDNAPVLKKNETSDGVKTLQRALRDLDYQLPISFKKTGDADGIFGDETEAVVKQFQRDNQLSDSGIVDRDTLRALDAKFNPQVTIESVFFVQDRRELINNETDWSFAGTKYVDWAHSPHHVVFEPGNPAGAKSIPISVDAGRTMAAVAKVNIKGGIPGRKYAVRGTPQGSMPGWTLSGEGTHQQGLESDWVSLSGEAPLTRKITFQDFVMLWETETSVKTTPLSLSSQKVFVTSGAAHNPFEVSQGVDMPNMPTFRRLKEATSLASGISAAQADRILHRIFRRFPHYGVCDVPTRPNPYGFTCPVLSSVWEMSDHVPGNFQCITISRYANAVFNVLGVPKAVESLVAKPVVIWANKEHKEDGIDSDYPHPGIGIPSVRHPRHRDWYLGLLDGQCGVNNYEACVKLEWTPPGERRPIVQYYCGGLNNPPEGFATPREILDRAFVLAYFVFLPTNDPRTGFPRGKRMKDVKVYKDNNCK